MLQQHVSYISWNANSNAALQLLLALWEINHSLCSIFYHKDCLSALNWPYYHHQEVYLIVKCFLLTGKHVLVFLFIISNYKCTWNSHIRSKYGLHYKTFSIFSYKPICILHSANNDYRFNPELQLRIMDCIIAHVSSWISRDIFCRWSGTLNAKYSDGTY